MNNKTKVIIIGLGAAGANILNEVIPMIKKSEVISTDVEFHHIDTSNSNECYEAETTIIGQGRGTGGDQRQGITTVKNEELLLNSMIDDNAMHIVIAGASGGTSIVIPFLAKKMLSREVASLFLLPMDLTHGTNYNNTMSVIKTLKHHAESSNGLAIKPYNNNINTVAEVNKMIFNDIQPIMHLCSNVKNIDPNDSLNLFKNNLSYKEHQGRLNVYRTTFDAKQGDDTLVIGQIEIDLNDKQLERTPIDGKTSKIGVARSVTKAYENAHRIAMALTLVKLDLKVLEIETPNNAIPDDGLDDLGDDFDLLI